LNRLIATTFLLATLLVGCAKPTDPAAPVGEEAGGLLLAVDLGAVAPDPAMERLIAPYRVEVEKLREPIGESHGGMIHQARKVTPLGCWVTDIMRERAAQVAGRPVDFAFTNSGGIRAALPDGPVSYDIISQILPFDNTLAMIDLDGTAFRRLLEKICSDRDGHSISGAFIEGDAENNLVSATIGGKALDDSRQYLVVTNNYLSSGGGGMAMLKEFAQQDTGVFQRDAVADHVRELTAAGKKIEQPADYPRYRYAEKKEGAP